MTRGCRAVKECGGEGCLVVLGAESLLLNKLKARGWSERSGEGFERRRRPWSRLGAGQYMGRTESTERSCRMLLASNKQTLCSSQFGQDLSTVDHPSRKARSACNRL